MTSDTRSKLCEKKIKTAEAKILKILLKIDHCKLGDCYVSRLSARDKKRHLLVSGGRFHVFMKKYKYTTILTVVAVVLAVCWSVYTEFSSKTCLLELPSSSVALFRPAEDCSMCSEVSAVVRLSNISAQEFGEEYAYAAVPVVVTDATAGWRAMEEFSFKFFANFYKNGKMGKRVNDCFFFPYKSGLTSLEEVFNMDEQRANLSGAPWYVGWSTCHHEETRTLRSYYSRPYFLPRTAESDMVDWLFMGGPGPGAHMHVDSVRHVSWQAQVRGRKQWQLAPPPECLYQCRFITFTVHPGEILVVDTNRWYHQTSVLPGDLSITIGAEYD